MKKRPTDFARRALAVVDESIVEPAETADELHRQFWLEMGVVAPMQDTYPLLVDKWGEEDRWSR